jgi:uncharacterized protein YlxW (UPF0749 family)
MVAVPLVFAMAGLMGATSAATARGTDLRAGAGADLASSIRSEQRRVDAEVRRVAALRAEVDRLSRDLSGGDAAAGDDRTRADRLTLTAGLAPVRGPAVTVSLDDAPRRPGEPLPEGITGDDMIVHQQDVQAVVNALWAGGAEAMQLMDQRVISTVGPVDAMREALAQDRAVRTYRDYVDRVGLGYSEEARASVTLPAYTGALELLHASAAG